jgi:hypothetical protein
VLSHVSALAFHDAPTWGLDLSQVHLTRSDGAAGRAEAGIVQHRGRLLPEDVVRLADFRLTTPTRACLEVIAVTTLEPALVVVNDMLHRGLTTLEALTLRYGAGMEHWPNTLSAGLVLRLANPLVESVGETRALLLCWNAGLPMPQAQYSVRDGSGRERWRLDFAWPELGVWLEFDGRAKYSEHLRPGETAADVVVREKKREEAIAAATGWICVRITWEELARPALVVRRIREAFARRASGSHGH